MRWFAICSLIILMSASAASAADTKSIKVEVFCPTASEEARQAYNAAVTFESQGVFDKAIELYRKAIDIDPGYCDAMDNIGVLYRRAGMMDQAIRWYKNSIEVFPENVVARTNLAVAYRLMDKPEPAISQYEKVIELRPQYAEGYYGLGSVYFELRNVDKALENFKKAEELYIEESSPHLPDAQFYLGVSYLMNSDQDKAIYYFELIYPEFRDAPEVNYSLGLAYMTKDESDLEQAREYMSRAQELGLEIPADIREKLSIE